jgi:hypothetical protein
MSWLFHWMFLYGNIPDTQLAPEIRHCTVKNSLSLMVAVGPHTNAMRRRQPCHARQPPPLAPSRVIEAPSLGRGPELYH